MSRRTLGLSSRGFRAYLATQFLGAMNDNAYKFLLLSFIAARTAGDSGAYTYQSSLAQALFAVPFVLLASWAGVLADRHRKSAVFVVAKVAEIALMAGVVAAFAVGQFAGLLALLFLMGAQSTFFGPAKYGWLPEVLDSHDLSRANGLVNMTTVVAVVAGQVVGGVLYDVAPPGGLWSVSLVLVAIAVAGTLTSLLVPRSEAAQPRMRLSEALPELFRTMHEACSSRPLLWTVLGIGHFYLLAALMQVQLFHYAGAALGAGSSGSAAFVALTLVGMAAGSVLAARWSERKVELGLVPMGALLMSLGLFLLAVVPGAVATAGGAEPAAAGGAGAGPVPAGVGGASAIVGLLAGAWPACLCIVLVGLGGGLFIVPLQANLQILAPEAAKGRFMAFGNMVSFVGVFLSAGVYALYGLWGFEARGQALATALFTLGGTVVSLVLLPEAFLRLCAWLLAHSVYRIRVLHGDRIPPRGGALLVANHVSWVDWLILLAATPRRIRFLIQREYYEHWAVNWLFRLGGCVPIASGDAPEVQAASLAAAGERLREGQLVAIFAEGTVTRTGFMNPIRSGYRRIVSGTGVPVIPIHLDGLWGSVFSHEGGRFLRHLPRRLPYPVTVTVGEGLPDSTPPWQLRGALQRLAAEAWEDRKHDRFPLHVALLRERRRSRERVLFEAGRPTLSRGAAVARALALRDAIARAPGGWGDRPRVGILLPAGHDALLSVLAALFAGRVPVLLPPGVPDGALAATLEGAGVGRVLSGAGAGPRTGAAAGVTAIDVTALGDLDRAAARWSRRLWWRPDGWAAALACAGPCPSLDDPCVLLLSGHSPLAVELSHHNVGSTLEALDELLALGDADRVLSFLPPSHAIGFTLGLWLPLLREPGAVWLRDRDDVRAAGDEVARRRVTLVCAQPADLRRLLAGGHPGRLGSVRDLVCSGNPLTEELREAFEQRFGLEPLDALEVTACSGLVTLNLRDVRQPGIFQRGVKHGTVGHPLPSTCVEVVDAAGRPCAPGEVGRLRVTGPGVTRSVLAPGARGAAPPAGAGGPGEDPNSRPASWDSGDEAMLDEDGFLTLTRRPPDLPGD